MRRQEIQWCGSGSSSSSSSTSNSRKSSTPAGPHAQAKNETLIRRTNQIRSNSDCANSIDQLRMQQIEFARSIALFDRER